MWNTFFARLAKVLIPQKRFGPQIAISLKVLKSQKDWVRKSHIPKVPHFGKVHIFADFRFSDLLSLPESHPTISYVGYPLVHKRQIVAEAYTTQPNSKASSRVLYNIFESTCGG